MDSNPEDQDDIIGHGTHLAILLRKIAPRAAVYIARVFTKKPSYQGAAEKIAEVSYNYRTEVDLIIILLLVVAANTGRPSCMRLMSGRLISS